MLLFNRYEYNAQADLIGKGGFSRVYKAFDKKLKRYVALKVFKSNQLSERYQAVAEIQRVIHLDHPNICRYFDIEEVEREDSFGEKEIIQVCVMELLDGGDFYSYYYSHEKDNKLLIKLLKDVITGLSYLHKNGVIHRDIKPANILIKQTVEGPVAKITDFGISKSTESTENSSSSALIVSIPYMAPEQFNAKKYGIEEKINYNIDFWSLGIAVYETITNDILFKEEETDSREQVMNNIMGAALPEKINRLPPPFLKFVSSCIVKDAKKRVRNPQELLNILDGREFTPVASVNADEQDTDLSDTATLIIQQPINTDDTRVLPDTKVKPSMPPVRKIAEPDIREQSSVLRRYDYNPQNALIGKGGFSRVYKAFDNKLDRWVALKIYKPGEFAEHYSPIAEIRRVINLDHPNICRYLDMEEIEKENSFGEKEKTQICVMELLDGGSFAKYYKEHPDNEMLKSLLNDVLNGLSYLHKNGIIHRDIKPANILIKETMDGPVAKITDFGISKKSDSVNANTSSALIVSIPYMAPEQLNTKKYGINDKIAYNLDLWSLGVTIYEVITGNVLFKTTEQDSPEQIMANIIAPELPDKINVLPQPFREIVSHCIIKDAKDRAQKAEELIVLLHSHLPEGQPEQEEIKSSAPEPTIIPVPLPAEPHPPTLKTSIFLESIQTGKPIKEKKPITEPPAKTNLVNKPNFNRLIIGGLGLLTLILLSVILFRKNSGKSDEKIPVVKTDKLPVQDAKNASLVSKDTTAARVSDSAHSIANTAVAAPVTTAKTPDRPELKQKKIPVTGNPGKTYSSKSEGNKNDIYILLLSASENCSVKINEEDYGSIKGGKQPIKVFLTAGEYNIHAVSTENPSRVINGKLKVTENNLHEVGSYKIVF